MTQINRNIFRQIDDLLYRYIIDHFKKYTGDDVRQGLVINLDTPINQSVWVDIHDQIKINVCNTII